MTCMLGLELGGEIHTHAMGRERKKTKNLNLVKCIKNEHKEY